MLVFAEYTALAIKYKAINLGQGFPSLPLAAFITDACNKSFNSSQTLHQYTRSEGHPRLVKALAELYRISIHQDINHITEIITTVGATEAIYSSINALIGDGDEVILMQPFYDSYPASIILAGGVPVVVSLTSKTGGTSSKDWTFSIDELEKAVTKKTKMLIINNPHNPIGKVFTEIELNILADFAKRHNILVMADEVYGIVLDNSRNTGV
jgi:kynurenine--oxoglutarate transaminase/cysteine-S-conjugate beta-lyase/glutamine--phenylpyruvate transaminase